MESPCIVAIKENPVQILQRVFSEKIHKSGPNKKKEKVRNCQI
jgi:hypothetical protein